MNVDHVYYLELRVFEGEAEARINDIPVAVEVAREGPAVVTIPIHEFSFQGENVLKLLASPNDPEEPGGYEATAKVARFRVGEPKFFEDGEMLADVRWREELMGAPVATRFDLSERLAWRWQNAPQIELNTETRAKLDAFVVQMHAWFKEKNLDAILGAMSPFFADMEEAYPPPLEGYTKEDFVRGWGKLPDPWIVAPFVPSPTNYRLVGDGRMVDLVDQENEALIRSIAGPGGERSAALFEYRFRRQVALKQGEVVVLR